MGFSRCPIVACTAAVFWALCPVLCGADSSAELAIGEMSATEVFSLASKSVVVVRSYGLKRMDLDMEAPENTEFVLYEEPRSQGSGVVIAPKTVVTNCHVLDDAWKVDITQGTQSCVGSLRADDRARDLCILATNDCVLTPARWRSSTTIRPGERVYALGAPRGLELTISEGIVAAIREDDETRLVQVTSPMSPGSSGGGVFDVSGMLVGITTFQFTNGQNLNFALPAEWAYEAIPRGEAAAARRKAAKDKFEPNASVSMFGERWGELEDRARSWVATYPDDERGWSYLANALLRQGAVDEAIEAYQHALSLRRRDVFKIDLARAYVGRALNERGTEWFLEGSLGQGLALHADIERAIHELEEVLAVSPENSEVLVELGSLLRRFQDKGRATQLLDLATQVDPKNAAAWIEHSFALWDQGRISEGLSAALRAADLAPDSFRAWFNLQIMAKQIGDQVLWRKAAQRLDAIKATWSSAK